jgi:hypothetical protein
MKVLAFKKPIEESLNLKGYRIVKTTHFGLSHFLIQKKVLGFLWRNLCYSPPGKGQHFPLLFDKQELALNFIRDVVAKESGSEVTWKG